MELTVRTHDRVQGGKLDVEDPSGANTTVEELLNVLRQEFGLDPSDDYFMRSDRLGKQLDPRKTLADAGVQEGDVLEVVPIIQAGR